MNDRPTEKFAGVGLVETRMARIELPPGGFKLECGRSLPELKVAYETYGALSPNGDNVVFICHALSGDASALSRFAGCRGTWRLRQRPRLDRA